jgi:hypothetical protein
LLLSYSFKREKHGETKSTTCAICWLKSILHEEKRWTGSDSGQTNATKTVSDVFRHRSGTGKSYCQTRSDVGSETVNKCHRKHSPITAFFQNTTLWMCARTLVYTSHSQEVGFVHHTLRRLDFECDMKILVLLSCCVMIIKRSFSFIKPHLCN